MESLKEYKTKRLMRELKKYRNLYEAYFEENYKQKMLLNTMAEDNAFLKRQLVELKFFYESKEDIERQKKIKKDIE